MAWTIHSWSLESESGTIRSPHFGPLPFASAANVDNVLDFREGETVLVEVAGKAPDLQVLSVRPTHQRQPVGTHCPAFDAVNGHFGDAIVEDSPPGSFQLWLGDCCQYCTPNPARLRFAGVTTLAGLDDDVDFSDPLFRVASAQELDAHHISVPPGATAYCVVSSHGQGSDGTLIFVVARSVTVIPPGTSEQETAT